MTRAWLRIFVLPWVGLWLTKPVLANEATLTSYVDLVTNKGTMTVGLYGNAAPLTTANFLRYVNAGLYKGTMIHRLLPDFVFQGGYINVFGQGDCVGGDRKTSVIASSESPSSTNCVAVFQAR